MTFSGLLAGEPTPQRVLFDSRAGLHEAVGVAVRLARHTLRALHRDLSVFGLASRDRTDALLQLLLSDRAARVRLLVDDAAWLETHAARLRLLQRRFPHALEMRIASPADPVGDDAWVLADDHAAIELRAAPATSGSLWVSHKPHMQPLLASFDRRWSSAGHNLPVSPLGLG